MEVRNIAARKLNELLGMEVECQFAKPSDWQDFREAIRVSVHKQLQLK